MSCQHIRQVGRFISHQRVKVRCFSQRIVLTDAGAVALSGQLANVSLLPISLLLFGGPERLT